jgi:hypothetical protein
VFDFSLIQKKNLVDRLMAEAENHILIRDRLTPQQRIE